MNNPDLRFSPSTAGFWQMLGAGPAPPPPYRDRYPATLPDGRYLELPLRPVSDDPDGNTAVASFIANQAAFTVVDALADFMIDLARPLKPEIIVGLPTLGLAFAPAVAKGLGFSHYVPLGYSRKYWYDDRLSMPVRSITTPGSGKALFIDPNLIERVRGKRVVIVDDAISSGTTMVAALRLLALLDVRPVGCVVAMCQTERWRDPLSEFGITAHGVFYSPRLCWTPAGWRLAPPSGGS